MGIPFIDMVTQQCGGHLELQSASGKGTELTAYFAADNIDRPPLGDIVSSVQVLLAGAPQLELEFAITALTARWCSERRKSEKY